MAGLHSQTILQMSDLIQLGPGHHSPVSIELQDADLWGRFHEQTNEMIVTKGGRRMFPLIKCRVKGLEPTSFYSILLEFKQIDNNRWKYINGEWIAGGKSEPAPRSALYTHPDSPNYGNHWSKEPISFQRVKLTNKTCCRGKIMLNSLHKYEPRIHVIKVDQGPSRQQQLVQTFAFPTTQFIAVTAYQNEDVTALKIKHNPFAKAFQQDHTKNGRNEIPAHLTSERVAEHINRHIGMRASPYVLQQRRDQPQAHQNEYNVPQTVAGAGGLMLTSQQMYDYNDHGDYSGASWNSNQAFWNGYNNSGNHNIENLTNEYFPIYTFNTPAPSNNLSPAFSSTSTPQASPDLSLNPCLQPKPENLSPPLPAEILPSQAAVQNQDLSLDPRSYDPWAPLTPPTMNLNQ